MHKNTFQMPELSRDGWFYKGGKYGCFVLIKMTFLRTIHLMCKLDVGAFSPI